MLINKTGTSHVCQNCGGEDFNNVINIQIVKEKVVWILCVWCRKELVKGII